MNVTEDEAPPAALWRVTYALTDADVVAFQRFELVRKRIWPKACAGIACSCIVLAGIFFTMFSRLSPAYAAAISLAVSMLTIALALTSSAIIWRIRLKKPGEWKDEMTLRVYSDTVSVKGAKVQMEVRLCELTHVSRNIAATHLHFVQSALIVPDRVFVGKEEAMAFHDYVMRGWQSSAEHMLCRTFEVSPFSVTCLLDDAALRHFAYSRLGRKRWLKGGVVAVTLFFLSAALIITWVTLDEVFVVGAPNSQLVGLLFPIGLSAGFYWVFAPAPMVKRLRTLFGSEPETIILSQTGISMSSRKASSEVAWAGIQRIDEDDVLIYLDLGPRLTIPIPKSAFLNAEDCSDFVSALRAYHAGEEPGVQETTSWPPRPKA